ncbi:uncharacterized protein LOC126779101 [Nymphalis io]|uniref:uncharacterized protein LOC126779101 n=1 Tax=Inachis io TaxID=171585 RepID=UPI0021673DBD|nr:uncharacterized protein LOC126779101 [Nymphalis io]
MSSSDSDDNIYGNIGKKLLKIRQNFQIEEPYEESPAETNKSFLNDSFLDELVENSKNIAPMKLNSDLSSATRKTKRKATGKPSKRGRKSKKSESSIDSDDSLINDVIFATSSSTRTTRSNSKRGGDRGLTTSRGWDLGRGTGNSRSTRDTSRGKAKRGRGRASKGKNNQITDPEMQVFPTYSIGNTDEYPDALEDVKLFSSKQNTNDNDVIEIDDIVAEENEELSVKVYWQSIDVYKFKIRKYQKLTQIFEHFSKQENVTTDKLLFTYNDMILKPDDSPDSIDYNIAKFIDGGIVYNNIATLTTKKSTNVKNSSGIKIKFQYSKSRKPFEMYIERDEKLSLAMTKCAEHLEVLLKNLKFEFDGDIITGTQTLEDLDMEGDECIDVKIVR